MSVEELIEALGLEPHPEGGFFRQSYRSSGRIDEEALPSGFGGGRCYGTAIYYLLPRNERSRWHRLRADEIWHFYLGGPLLLAHISPEGVARVIRLGRQLQEGEVLQYTIPAGHWMAAAPGPDSPYSLVGCTVAPGFEFSDLEMVETEALAGMYPHARQIIEGLGK